jgi:hypothetical protein
VAYNQEKPHTTPYHYLIYISTYPVSTYHWYSTVFM